MSLEVRPGLIDRIKGFFRRQSVGINAGSGGIDPMVLVHERLSDQLRKNREQAAQNLIRQGLSVDYDELAWDSANTIERFVSQDPEQLVSLAEETLGLGMITRQTYNEMLEDAALIRLVQARDKARFEASKRTGN